ncbi:MAG: RNA polymerase sigma factor [Thermoleophilaceae bacterium]|jgi:RNA polymerase sigma factor (sigma-70 family)|nr:RNA polymerase sigma factor [Thermoleophilaceae bacterium]
MEASALSNPSSPALLGRSPLVRLQSDEKLIALVRRGHPSAFEVLVERYQARLHSFCRHMLGSTEDAEDVLQEVFASAYNAIRADNRPINVRPWLYRIARNRALNHMRRPSHAGQDSMDVFERAGGETTADAVHRREDFRLLVADVQALPENQRTALLMREMDALSYEHIAEAMESTVPSVKSLLVRARVGLAEAAEGRLLSCDTARVHLGEAAEGIAKVAPAVRRHVNGCARCRVFRSELRRTSRALAAVYPVGPLVVVKKLVWGKLGFASGGGGGAGGSGAVGGSTLAGSAWGGGAVASGSALGGGLLGSAGAGGLLSTGVGAIAAKAAVGLVAAAVVTAGAVEVRYLTQAPQAPPPSGQVAAAPPAAPAGDAPPTEEPTTVAAATTPTGPEGAETPGAPAAGSSAELPGDGSASTAEPAVSDPGAVAAAAPVTTASDHGAGSGGSGGGGSLPVDDFGGGSTGSGSTGKDDDAISSPPRDTHGGNARPSTRPSPPGDPGGSSPGAPGPPPIVGESAGSSY